MAPPVEVFERLGMHRTELRAGVLVTWRGGPQAAVIGDAGIHTRVGSLLDALVARISGISGTATPDGWSTPWGDR